MSIIAKYKFNQSTYADFIPEFNSEFTDYTITDETDTDGYVVRTIGNDSGDLPTLIRFGTTADGEITSIQARSLLSVEYINTSNVTDMSYMFNNCYSLTSLDASNFNTSNVTDMRYMFYACSKLTSLDLSNFDTSNVTSMGHMFRGCYSLTSLNVSNFNTNKVTDMEAMFQSCSKLTSLDVSNFNTSIVTNMGYMFSGCSALTSLDLSSFDTSNVTLMSNIFSNITSSTTIYLNTKTWNIDVLSYSANFIRKATYKYMLAKYTFNNTAGDCLPTITGVSASQWGYSDAINDNITTRTIGTDDDVKITKYSFSGKSNLLTVDYLAINSNITSLNALFQNCTSLTYVNSKNWDTSNVTDMATMCNGASKLTSIDVSNWNTNKVTSLYYTFSGCASLSSLNTSGWNTSSVTTMANTFFNCGSLTSLDLSNSHINNVTILTATFSGCTSLESLNAPNWNIHKATDISNLFYNCQSLTTLNISNLDTSKITTMNYVFYGCSKLVNLDLSNWNTSSVKTMPQMFQNCSSLTTLDVSTWNTKNVTNIYFIFAGCIKLNDLDLKSWDTNSMTNIGGIFHNWNSKQIVYISSRWKIDTSSFTPTFIRTFLSKLAQYTFNNTVADLLPSIVGLSSDLWTYSDTVDGNITTRTIGTDVESFSISRYSFGSQTSLLTVEYLRIDAKITGTHNMFQNCSQLTSINTSNWDTSGVKDIHYMFANCSALTTLDVSNFNTEKVTNMQNIFTGCSSLTSLDLSSWNTSLVTNMASLFQGCSSLTSLDLSNFDTSKVTSFNNMFGSCTKLAQLGAVYCNSSTINSLLTPLGTSVARNVYYADANISELTAQSNITYIPYIANTVSCGQDITLRSNGIVRDELNVETGEFIQRIGEDGTILPTPIITTVDIITTDVTGKEVDLTYLDGKTTFVSSSEQLKPNLLLSTDSTFDVMLKPSTQYTVKVNRPNIVQDVPLVVNLGGTESSVGNESSFTITTPSTITDSTIFFSGTGNAIKDVMVIEGEYVDRDLDFFEGFISVENPILTTTGKNLVFLDKNNPDALGSWSGNGTSAIRYDDKKQAFYTDTHRGMCSNVTFKPNTYYIISAEFLIRNTNSYSFNWQSPQQSMGTTFTSDTPFNETTWVRKSIKRLSYNNGKIGWIVYNGVWFRNLQIEEAESLTEYEPYQGNILTTYPQVTLRSIGDIKDEWDVVGETVTRRIGKIVLDGSETIHTTNNGANVNKILFKEKLYYQSSSGDDCNYLMCDELRCVKYSGFAGRPYDFISIGTSGVTGYESAIFIKFNSATTMDEWKDLYSQITPITLYYQLETPTTEPVRITPPNPQTSTASITLPTQLNHVEDTSDFLVWNPYKEHYVRYNYVEDGVVLDNYTWENLTDSNERQFVEFYNKRTYVYQPYHNYVASHDSKGTSKYVLIEPNQDYTVTVRFSELPTCETVKVNLGGAEVEMNVNDPHVHVTTPNTLANNLCSISGDGLDGKVTDILVIHCLEHEGFADIDYFEGIDGIGEIVDNKVSIIMEQTNGNLIDGELVITNNGTAVATVGGVYEPIRPNKSYHFNTIFVNQQPRLELYNKNKVHTRNAYTHQSPITTTSEEVYYRLNNQFSTNGSAHVHIPMELCYANMEKDYIRPRYYDKEEILLPMQLHRINTVYDNFYYDEMKGYYRIQQSIGHKYFVGAESENWTLIERGQRVLRFRYNNADIQMKSLGEFMTNRLPNGTATSPYECCAFSGSTFIVSIDKERLTSESLIAFKEWLANNNLHLYYQLASPLMIDLPQYPNRIEFNTYKDEIYTFFKNCKPTVFTLSVPLDQTYRFYDLEEGQGYANRIELTDERMTEEDKSYVHTIYGSGISNLIEEPNNVDTMLKPNYEGKATSHSLTNGQVSTIGVHGFEANDITIENYNTVTKQYELTVQAQQGTNTNTETLAIPYKLEIYEDGTKDRVYYNSQYKQWMFEGGQTLTVPYNESTGAFTSVVEVFRGLQPRSGLIGEFKVRFASGTTSARLYYSINGTTYGYTILRGMTDEVDYYIGFFNTGGTKIDMGTKIDANTEYTTLVPINATVPECLMINQIQSITECTYYQDKTYYYSDVVSPLLLDVYNGTTTITELNGAIVDIRNNAHNKQALIYGDTTYTVYWTYIGGEGNIKVTLGGATQEVAATQGYVTITTGNTDLERGLFIGGFDVTIKDLMLIKGERITDLKYFEGSRAVGTAFTNEDGNTMYKITFVTGSELINDKFEDMITFEDNKKHNVVVTKLLGAKPNKN